MHLAALNEYSYCANMLLAYGADITARTNGGTSALAMIVRKIPNVLPKFEDMLGEFPIGRENSTHPKSILLYERHIPPIRIAFF